MSKVRVNKGFIFIIAALAVLGGFYLLAQNNMIPGAKIGGGMEVKSRADLSSSTGPSASRANVPEAPLPSSSPVSSGLPLNWEVMEWNSQMGAMFANGGPITTQGSLMEKRGVKLTIIRQNDTAKMQEDLIRLAKHLDEGSSTANDVHLVAVMGDGSSAFIKGINDSLAKLAPDLKAEIIGSAGRSDGEDAFMGPAMWKANPQSALGGVVAAFMRDGDFNIVVKWCIDNGLKVNPDEKVYDPDAVNFMAAADFLDAVDKFNYGTSATLPIVKNGKKTGQTKTVTADAVTTWTPGDERAAKGKGGIVRIVSTKQNRNQMPNAIIGIKRFNERNREAIVNMLVAIAEGGAQVNAHDSALTRAAEISAQVYQNQDGAYWKKYYLGVTEPDKMGTMVELGGSYANTMADMAFTFGLLPGSSNLMEATYTTFGNIYVEMYPDLMPDYPPARETINTSYTAAAMNRMPVTQQAQAAVTPTYSANPIKQTVSRRGYAINFVTGSATLTPDAERMMSSLLNNLMLSNLVVEIHGHTDSVGSTDLNQKLSENRAFAVKTWLEQHAPANFPQGRVRIFAHGPSQPVASNDTDEGRAANRRVEIVQGSN